MFTVHENPDHIDTGPDGAAPCLDGSHCGVGEQLREADGRDGKRRSIPPAQERLSQRAEKDQCGGCGAVLVHDGDGQRLPEGPACFRCLALGMQPVVNGEIRKSQFLFRSPAEERCPRAKHPQTIGRRKEIGEQDAPCDIERRLPRGQFECSEAPRGVEESEDRPRLNSEVPARANLRKKSHGRFVAGDQDVLAIVKGLSARGIGERPRPATWRGFLLEQKNRDVLTCKIHSGGEAAQTCADDHHRFHRACPENPGRRSVPGVRANQEYFR
jgi:hypothetical protein